MKKVQRMLNFHTYKRIFCANCDVIAKIIPQNHEDSKELLCSWVNCDVIALKKTKFPSIRGLL